MTGNPESHLGARPAAQKGHKDLSLCEKEDVVSGSSVETAAERKAGVTRSVCALGRASHASHVRQALPTDFSLEIWL